MQIKIGKVPGRTQVLEIQDGARIADAVREAGLDVTGHELRFNGTSTEDFNKLITDGAIILLTPRIKGNSDSEYISANFKGDEYALSRTSKIRDLLYAADWDTDDIEDDELVAYRKNGNWVAVDLYDEIIQWANYDVVDKDEAVFPVTQISNDNECNCGGNCRQTINIDGSQNGEIVKVIVGNLEIVINKIG